MKFDFYRRMRNSNLINGLVALLGLFSMNLHAWRHDLKWVIISAVPLICLIWGWIGLVTSQTKMEVWKEAESIFMPTLKLSDEEFENLDLESKPLVP